MDDMEKQKALKAEINELQNKLAFQRNYINNLEDTCQTLEKKVKTLSQSVDVSLQIFFLFGTNSNVYLLF